MTETTRPRQLSITETAIELRRALKGCYPGLKFSVRCDAPTIRVAWTDGPTMAQLRPILDRFTGSDVVDDCLTPRRAVDLDGELVRFGADFVHGVRSLSPEYQRHFEAIASSRLGEPVDLDRWYYTDIKTPWGRKGNCNGHTLIRWMSEQASA